MPASSDSAAGDDADEGASVDSFIAKAVDADDPPAASNPYAELCAGEVLSNRFLIREFSRRGGMSRLYRAREIQTGNEVAIKVMDRLGRTFSDRFAREAQVLAGLTHPGVVRYIAHGTTANGTLYLAMEWLHGRDLCERLASEGRLALSDAIHVAKQTCAALAALHEREVVHRDIKPSNLFICNDAAATVKVLDFGVARLCEDSRGLTGAGTMLGTVGYMAPEQARAEQGVDRRADVFAVGCVLYECLTGRAPFTGNRQLAILSKILNEDPPPLRQLCPEASVALEELLSRMLAKNAADRPDHAGAVLGQLQALVLPESAGT